MTWSRVVLKHLSSTGGTDSAARGANGGFSAPNAP